MDIEEIIINLKITGKNKKLIKNLLHVILI